jgi:uncharacterized protein YqhQ
MKNAWDMAENSFVVEFVFDEEGSATISTSHKFSPEFPEEAFQQALAMMRGLVVIMEADPSYIQKMAYASYIGVQLDQREKEIEQDEKLEELPTADNIAKVNFSGRRN